MEKQAKGIVKHIPNFITSLNIFCGTSAIVFAFKGDLQIASYLVLIASVFDFMDGLAARVLHAYSELGKQLDSLADLVSFGVAPSAIIYNLLLISEKLKNIEFIQNYPNVLLLVFIITIFSAIRLAKFNIDTRQSSSFIGLPTPANAIFWVSFPLLSSTYVDGGFISEIATNPYLIFVLIISMSLLLISEIPMFSLKFKNFQFKENMIRYIFLILAIFLFVILNTVAIPVVILMYILLSIFSSFLKV